MEIYSNKYSKYRSIFSPVILLGIYACRKSTRNSVHRENQELLGKTQF